MLHPPTTKPHIWLLEEATPDVALLMHQIERTGAKQAEVRRVTYTEALRDLSRESARGPLAAIVVFSLANLQTMAALVKRIPAPSRPRLLFWAPKFEALAKLKPHMRFPIPVGAVARHAGEAASLIASGFRVEQIVRLDADVQPGFLPEPAAIVRPLRVGVAWYNMAAPLREQVRAAIARWIQSAPDRCEWHIFCLPGDEADFERMPGVRVSGLTATAAAVNEPLALDAWLADPWWPEAQPRPWRAPVTIHLPPGGSMAPEPWSARLQALLDLGEPARWHDDMLWAWQAAPVWKSMLGREPEAPATPPLAPQFPDLAELESARTRWHRWLTATRQNWQEHPEAATPEALAYYFWLYDYRVEVSWCLDLWGALATRKNGERHALLLALNALRLHHTGSAWLLKRLLAQTNVGRPSERKRRFGRRFWLRFIPRHAGLLAAWMGTVWRCDRDSEADPLAASQAVARAILTEAKVRVVARNAPAPVPGIPTIYLLSHRHGDLDPFLLLHVLPGQLAVVVGPRAQRWPLINRLGSASAFVLTGRERGVVIADAIAAVRARRALAIYPEVTEPSYLGEGSPFRAGLVWIVQALERSQVIPVVIDDAFALGPEGGEVDLWFGPPIMCSPETGDELLHAVRGYFHRHVVQLNELDGPGSASAESLESVIAVEPPLAQPSIPVTDR